MKQRVRRIKEVEGLSVRLNEGSALKKLVFIAFLAVIAAILQSLGNYLPGIGLILSTLATFPVIIAALISFRHGVFTYLLGTVLLFLIEPSEFFMFPFTTGLLGLGLGLSFQMLRKTVLIAMINGAILTIGICIPLYLLKFPVLGPISSFQIKGTVLLAIFIFAVVYSFIWVKLGLYLVKKVTSALK